MFISMAYIIINIKLTLLVDSELTYNLTGSILKSCENIVSIPKMYTTILSEDCLCLRGPGASGLFLDAAEKLLYFSD